MVQTKHQKLKTKKQPHAKKHGKQADISDLRGQFDALGLKIIQVTADGNCFFRSYHDGEHYHNIRLKEDPCDGPARTIVIKADTSLRAASDKAKVVVTKSKGGHGGLMSMKDL
ncbi:hypothetical protein RJ641_011368 [Dillenia turbinata]|uniref:OTU domain-containing protein n=1 Tax=Dillenia turbinata TaxID=194707 RepID=A0AAN8UYB2_9MAGN